MNAASDKGVVIQSMTYDRVFQLFFPRATVVFLLDPKAKKLHVALANQ
jgi:hypothetical protein